MDAVPAGKRKNIKLNVFGFRTSNADGDAEDDQAEDEEDDGPRPGELWADAGDLPAVRAAGQGVVESVEEEGVVTVGAGHAAHPRHVGQRRRHRGRGRQVDDPLAVGPVKCA